MAYVIHRTRHYYGPEEIESLEVANDSQGRPLVFRTKEKAEAFIEGMEGDRYYLAHNESSRPDLVAMAIDDLPSDIREQYGL